MAAKSKKRLSKIENKVLKLEKLELKDIWCSICNSILVEPVTLPCFHDFCLSCFNGSVENNALCCPLCRLRIGSWLRTATKHKNLVNIKLWNFIKTKFEKEVHIKLKGGDLHLPEEKFVVRLSGPGEIKLEYEAELKRLRSERLKLEEKHLVETENLIKKLQNEEKEAQERYLERLKEDELLAKRLHKNFATSGNSKCRSATRNNKARLKSTKIDSYVYKKNSQSSVKSSTDEDTNTSGSTSKSETDKNMVNGNGPSPELVPSYGTYLKNFIDKKIRNVAGLWNKENGRSLEKPSLPSRKTDGQSAEVKSKKPFTSGIQSLPVSLPYSGSLSKIILETQATETDSVDSVRQELCYFKPIEATTPTNLKAASRLPLRVPGKHADVQPCAQKSEAIPTRAQYLDSLTRLRSISASKNLPSAFVLALKMLQVDKGTPTKLERTTRNKLKKQLSDRSTDEKVSRKCATKNKNNAGAGSTPKLDIDKTLRRTRSMGSLPKTNETTPKKAKVRERKVVSERKPYLRSDSKKSNCIKKSNKSPPLSVPESVKNNHKVNLVMKNLSTPLGNCCNVKKILEEQLQIEKIIEQEKKDLELARKMQAEWNGQRLPRRAALKRQLPPAYALRPAKKLKV